MSDDWGRGSCQNKYVYSGRKKRDTAPWDEVLQESNMDLVDKIRRARVERQAQPQVETEEEIEVRSYGSRLRYECGAARMFYDIEAYEGEDPYYTERWMTCNWNNSWTLTDTLDECRWVQCLYPPDPPAESGLLLTWTGDPVEFYENVTYVCAEGTFFEWDREMVEYNISCMEGGSWDKPTVWPVCVPCKLIQFKYHKLTFLF